MGEPIPTIVDVESEALGVHRGCRLASQIRAGVALGRICKESRAKVADKPSLEEIAETLRKVKGVVGM